MSPAEPFVRESGRGPSVVCIHANASNSGQWRPLMDLLTSTHRVLAPDCYGAGKSPEGPSADVMALADEVRFLQPVFAQADAPFSLVGHSYGGAVALRAALEYPGRVRALVLYEPTLFSIIDADPQAPHAAQGILAAVSAAVAALERGDADAAAGHFIDYWMGPGAWKATPEERKPAIAASMRNVRRWAHALMTEPTPAAAFETLDVPVLLLTGGLSTPAAHAVARRLVQCLPRCRHQAFPDLGHMGPTTHPQVVYPVMAQFLREC